MCHDSYFQLFFNKQRGVILYKYYLNVRHSGRVFLKCLINLSVPKTSVLPIAYATKSFKSNVPGNKPCFWQTSPRLWTVNATAALRAGDRLQFINWNPE